MPALEGDQFREMQVGKIRPDVGAITLVESDQEAASPITLPSITTGVELDSARPGCYPPLFAFAAPSECCQDAAAEAHIRRDAISPGRFDNKNGFVDLDLFEITVRQSLAFAERDIPGVDIVRGAR